MILSDGLIREAIEQGRIVFDPVLSSDHLDTALSTSALDLRLDNELTFYRSLAEVQPGGFSGGAIDPTHKPDLIPGLIKQWGRVESIENSFYVLEPHQFVLGQTLEYISLPVDGALAARVEGRSTLARLGFVTHMTAPTVHCGFEGNIILEIYNYGPYPIKLIPGMFVCQLILEEVGATPETGKVSQYQGQTGPGSPAP